MGMGRIHAWSINVIVLASVLAVANMVAPAEGVAVPSAVTGGASWPTAGHDIQNTRDTLDEHEIGPENASRLKVAWSITTGGDVVMTPTVADGVVYFGDYAGGLWAVTAGTGQVLWKTNVSSYAGYAAMTRNSPAIYGDELIFGGTARPGHGAYMFAVNRGTGALMWSTQVDAHPAAIVTSSPVVYRGVAYMGVSSVEEDLAAQPGYQCCTFRGSVVALGVATGRILWKTYTVPTGYSGGAVWGSTPAIDPADHMVFVGTGNNYSAPPGVCAAPTSTGCTPPAADDHFDSVLGLDLTTGAIQWSRRTLSGDLSFTGCNSSTNPACGPNYDFGSGPNLIQLPSGRMLLGVGQKSGVYWALDPRTGAVVWRTAVGPGSALGGIMWGSATDGRHIYVAISDDDGLPYSITSADGHTTSTDGGSWAELDAATGKILWQVADPQQAADVGYVSTANGLIYAGSTADTGNDMFVLNATDGGILWSFAGGGPVVSGAAIANGLVYWGTGYTVATRCPGGTGSIQSCTGSGDKLYAFNLPANG